MQCLIIIFPSHGFVILKCSQWTISQSLCFVRLSTHFNDLMSPCALFLSQVPHLVPFENISRYKYCVWIFTSLVVLSNVFLFLLFRSRWCFSFVATSWIRRTSLANRILSLCFTAATKTGRKSFKAFFSPIFCFASTWWTERSSHLDVTHVSNRKPSRHVKMTVTYTEARARLFSCSKSSYAEWLVSATLHNPWWCICDILPPNPPLLSSRGGSRWADKTGQSWQEENKEGSDGIKCKTLCGGHFYLFFFLPRRCLLFKSTWASHT